MTGYDFKFTNKAGDFIIINEGSQAGSHIDPYNVYALQKYPTFTKSFKNNEIARQGQVGVWDFYSYYGRLSIVFSGIIVAETNQKLEQMKAKMSKIFALPMQPTETNDGYVKIEWTDEDGNSKFVEAKLTQDIAFDRGLADHSTMSFLINLKTKTPYIYSGGIAGDYLLESGIRGYKSSGGIFLPTLLPISWSGDWQNVLSIDNSTSTTESQTKIKIFGEAQQQINNPRITNLTTGKFMQVNITLADETDWIEIDAYNGTIKNKNGDDVSGLLETGSAFITLIVGINELVYTSNENPYISLLMPTAVYEVRYLNAYDY